MKKIYFKREIRAQILKEFRNKFLIKQLIKESINEVSMDQLQTQFVDTGKIEKEDFEEIKKSTSKSAYATWLVGKVNNNTIKSEDIYKFKKYFDIFNRRKKEYPHSDINQYKTSKDIQTFIETSLKLSQEEESDVSKQKGVSKSDKFSEFKIGNVDGFDVYEIPKGKTDLYGMSCEMGSGTEWCTSTGNTRSYFDNYIKDGPIFIFLKGNEKYQFHYESNQFMDKHDQSII